MFDLQDLYQEVLMDHNRRPRNFRTLDEANRSAEGFNPLCGDKITLFLEVEDGLITDVGFQGAGCAISRASASMMTDSIKGKTIEEATKISDGFRLLVSHKPGEDVNAEELGDLEVLSGVAAFPARIKCATLCWHTLQAALNGREDAVSTDQE